MTGVEVIVTGTERTVARLATISAELRGPVLEAAVMTGALVVVDAAKRLAPYKTGNLRRSIHAEKRASGIDSAEASAGTDVVYAARLEYGFQAPDALGRVYHQPARPYMRPAADENEAAITKAIEAVVDAAIASAT